MRNKKGIALIMGLGFSLFFAALTVFYINTTVSGFKLTKQMTYSAKAFYLAESGVQKALYELRKDYNWPGEGPVSLDWAGSSKGYYEVAVTAEDNKRHIVSTGYYPTKYSALAKRAIEAYAEIVAPSWFFNNAMTAGEDVDLNGNYTVTGDILYGDSIDPADLGQQLDGEFPLLNFSQLKAVAESQIKPDGQNNLYTAADIESGKAFPDSFWFDEANQIPNIVYVETDLTLRGNVGTVGGFFVVAGNVITSESGSADTTINGNGTIDGCVYTLGDFRINGGGNGLGVTGGVWAKDDVTLNGNSQVAFNQEYMQAINSMNISFKPQMTSWKEKF